MLHGIKSIGYINITYLEARAVLQIYIHSPYKHKRLTTCRLKAPFSSHSPWRRKTRRTPKMEQRDSWKTFMSRSLDDRLRHPWQQIQRNRRERNRLPHSDSLSSCISAEITTHKRALVTRPLRSAFWKLCLRFRGFLVSKLVCTSHHQDLVQELRRFITNTVVCGKWRFSVYTGSSSGSESEVKS